MTVKTFGYCRVSSQKQKDDLEWQVENIKTYPLPQSITAKLR